MGSLRDLLIKLTILIIICYMFRALSPSKLFVFYLTLVTLIRVDQGLQVSL